MHPLPGPYSRLQESVSVFDVDSLSEAIVLLLTDFVDTSRSAAVEVVGRRFYNEDADRSLASMAGPH